MSYLNVNQIQTAGNLPSFTTGANTITFNGSTNVIGASSAATMKNRIINGDMRIDQRNGGGSVTNMSGNVYTVDRWQAAAGQASKFTVQQNAGSVTPPAGFSNYLGCTSSSAYTPATGEVFIMRTKIEGYNIVDLAWGTSSAKTITISFWVRSSLTGTFGGALANSDSSRTYAFNYTINSANTWEYKTVTIVGDTSGTWQTTTGIGIEIRFSLGAASDQSGTAGSWSSSNYYSATGAVQVVATNGATLYITGVQLEVGSAATSFDFRNYQTELALCQRYLPAISTAGATGSASFICNGYNASTGAFYGIYSFKVTPRTPPTGITTVNPTSSFNVFAYGSSYSISAITYLGGTPDAATFYATCTSLNVGQGSALSAINSSGQILFTGCEL